VGLAVAAIGMTGLLTGVNYVPDSVSSPLYGFALRLYADGFTPPTLLTRWVPNPVPGGLWLLALGAAASLTGVTLLAGAKPWREAALGAVLCVALFFGILAQLPRNPEADAGAVGHLESVWSAPPGHRLPW
jgi:hypothetical protein